MRQLVYSMIALWTSRLKSFHDLLSTTNQEQLLQIYHLEDTTQANYPRHFAQVPAKQKAKGNFVRSLWQMLNVLHVVNNDIN